MAHVAIYFIRTHRFSVALCANFGVAEEFEKKPASALLASELADKS